MQPELKNKLKHYCLVTVNKTFIEITVLLEMDMFYFYNTM